MYENSLKGVKMSTLENLHHEALKEYEEKNIDKILEIYQEPRGEHIILIEGNKIIEETEEEKNQRKIKELTEAIKNGHS